MERVDIARYLGRNVVIVQRDGSRRKGMLIAANEGGTFIFRQDAANVARGIAYEAVIAIDPIERAEG